MVQLAAYAQDMRQGRERLSRKQVGVDAQPRSQGLSSLALWGGKMRNPGNEVGRCDVASNKYYCLPSSRSDFFVQPFKGCT